MVMAEDEDRLLEPMQAWRELGIDRLEILLAISEIRLAIKAIDANIDAILRPFDITGPRDSILTRLYMAKDGQLTLGQIAHVLRLHPTSVTSGADRLERDGLIQRVPHPTDRRATLARITPKGRQLVDDSLPKMLEAQMGLPHASSNLLRRMSLLMREVRIAAGDPVADKSVYVELLRRPRRADAKESK